MRLVLVTENFPPLRTSGAVQLRDLSREFVRQGHRLTILLPDSTIKTSWTQENLGELQILRLKAPRTKGIGYFRRTVHEFLMPFAMRRQLKQSPWAHERFDGVVWYSPSIFHGPLVKMLKRQSCSRSYLIIRDVFPEWAVDIGLIERGLRYRLLDAVARYQYSVADVIGVQSSGNLVYFRRWQQQQGRTLEVLQNWLGKSARVRCPIRLDETVLAGRQVFVYAGNMGVAQGMDIVLDLAEQLLRQSNVGFLLVGRGSEVARLKASVGERALDNVLFYDEIHPDEIPDLYAQCCAGIVVLDPRHRSHNIPGKFLTYLRSGLPVLANVNAGNDLAQMIRDHRVGRVCENSDSRAFRQLADQLLEQMKVDANLPTRCKRLFEKKFAVEAAVKQIVAALTVK